jgi:hypothetical protein
VSETIWPSPASSEPTPDLLDWVRAEGLDPDRISKGTFLVQRDEAGIRFIYQELTRGEDGRLVFHECAHAGCADMHLPKGAEVEHLTTTPAPASLLEGVR